MNLKPGNPDRDASFLMAFQGPSVLSLRFALVQHRFCKSWWLRLESSCSLKYAMQRVHFNGMYLGLKRVARYPHFGA